MTEHYFTKEPTSKESPLKIRFRSGPEEYWFSSGASVFSKEHVDPGSKLLISECRLPEKGIVLDIGCGYGIVGIMLKLRNPQLAFTLSDVNLRALEFARRNAKSHKVEVSIVESDLFHSLGNFDCILSNPPQHAGKEVCFKLIEEAKKHLNPGGSLQLVVRHQRGGRHLSQRMEEVFGNMEDIGRQSGYHIYLSTKN